MKHDDMGTAALRLPPPTRVELVEKRLPGLEMLSEKENLGRWVEEAQRRLAELRAGLVDPVPIDEVFRGAYATLS